jgi:hypothetical protein
LADGRRLVGEYSFERDWGVVRVEGSARTGQARWVHRAVRQLLQVRETPSPRWVIDAAEQLPELETPLGVRVMCRCCGFLTLHRYGQYEICPVCRWEDDPTTIFAPGEPGGPGPNHLSLTEARQNFVRAGISTPGKDHNGPRAPLPEERP